MQRRDLLKAGFAAMGAGAIAMSGCTKNEHASIVNFDEEEITPKQTATYEFSTPLPFNYKTIDDILELNSNVKKCKVTGFYNSYKKFLAC
ncbi:hypothetical protein IJ531_04770 [bacterium]|nr:hypothetical protein [bacterium]